MEQRYYSKIKLFRYTLTCWYRCRPLVFAHASKYSCSNQWVIPVAIICNLFSYNERARGWLCCSIHDDPRMLTTTSSCNARNFQSYFELSTTSFKQWQTIYWIGQKLLLIVIYFNKPGNPKLKTKLYTWVCNPTILQRTLGVIGVIYVRP